MLIVDNYRKDWALRYLREAKVDLKIAEEAPITAPNTIIEALKKGQLALYYILGEPNLIEEIVETESLNEKVDDPLLRFLSGLDKAVEGTLSLLGRNNKLMLNYANELLNLISDIISLFT